MNADFQSGGVTTSQITGLHCLLALTDCSLPTFLPSWPRLRALSSAHQVALATFSSRFEVCASGIRFLALQGKRKQQVALIEKQQLA